MDPVARQIETAFDGLAGADAGSWIAMVVGIGVAVLLLGMASLLLAPRFQARALLNGTERRVFTWIEAALPAGMRLLAQVSYGEMLRCASRRRFAGVNAKRADMVITDRAFTPVLVIEVHGGGHFGASWRDRRRAMRRDETKARALREAGVALLIVPDTARRGEVERLLREALPTDQATTAAAAA